MKRIIGTAFLAIGACAVAMAQVQSPEVDPASGGSALALLAGALVIYQSRRKR